MERTFEGSVEAEDAELRKYEHHRKVNGARRCPSRWTAAVPPECQREREERTLCSLTAERQMNGDCVCVCMCRAARCEWRLGNTTFVWLRPTRGAARVGSSAHQQRQSSLPSAALPQPSFLCLSSICWSDRRGSLARSFVRQLESRTPSRIITQTLECVHGDLRVVLGVGRRSASHRASTQCRHIILSSLSLHGLHSPIRTRLIFFTAYRKFDCALKEKKLQCLQKNLFCNLLLALKKGK